MKAPVVLSLLLLACAAAAQPPEADHSLQSGTLLSPREKPRIFHPEDRYEIHGRRFTYTGLAVQVAKSSNPVGMFNPFNPDNFDPQVTNTVWDSHTGRPLGWSILTIKF